VEDLVMIEVVGYSESAARKVLDKEGFTNVKVVEEENHETQEGYVFDQSVKEGEVIPADTEIILKVSKGAEELDVPNVVGYTDEQAVKVLTEGGNFEVAHAYNYSDDVEEDRVIEQEPKAGTKAPKGTKITITISNGSQIKEVSAPNLQGMNESQAKNTLTGMKLVVGTIKHEYSDTVPEGQVIRQEITSGTTLKEGDTIGFTISDGPEPKVTTYTAHISGVLTCSDPALDGQAVTIQLYYNGSQVSTQPDVTVVNGTSYNITATIPGLSNKDSSASVSVKCYDGGGNDVTSAFPVTTPITISYTEE
ncbi:MAG: PASTA domain-containing protein, partial [Lachnospiraceae bacterium]|nr:PASTA domain-containing protein [Lachnospiraceae bacterium]